MDISKWAQCVFFLCTDAMMSKYNRVYHLHVKCDPFTVQKCLSETVLKVTEEHTFLPSVLAKEHNITE